jgi:ADP-ribose pyrophosphatase YjhB (NUDIX family)
MLVPVDKGLLTVRRNVEPKRGSLAFPGGYVDLNETWQEAGVRELWEETGIKAAASDVTEVAVISSVERGILVVFGSLPPRPESDLPPFQPNKETTGWEIVTAPCELAFQSHTEVMARWFATRRV